MKLELGRTWDHGRRSAELAQGDANWAASLRVGRHGGEGEGGATGGQQAEGYTGTGCREGAARVQQRRRQRGQEADRADRVELLGPP